MNAYTMTNEQIIFYGESLRLEERCEATVQKYVGAVTALFDFLPDGKVVSQEAALAWKEEISGGFTAGTVNVMISAANRFFAFMKWNDVRLKQIKTQRRIFRDRDRELTKTEYMRLLNAAWKNDNLRLYYLMQTLGSTGVRVSELRFITVEAVHAGKAVVDCKGKRREVLIPKKLRKRLLAYCEEAKITSGPVFVTKNGKPLKFLPDIATVQRLSGSGHEYRAGCDIRFLAVGQQFLPQLLRNQDFAPFALAVHDRLASMNRLHSNETQFGHADARRAERLHQIIQAQVVVFPRRVQEAYVLRFRQFPVAVAENPTLHFKLFNADVPRHEREKTVHGGNHDVDRADAELSADVFFPRESRFSGN